MTLNFDVLMTVTIEVLFFFLFFSEAVAVEPQNTCRGAVCRVRAGRQEIMGSDKRSGRQREVVQPAVVKHEHAIYR